MFQAGQTVGGYELVERVAAGGMATVFVARKDGEVFALKVVHEHLSQDWEAMRWFIDEALISIRIRHPNIVRVDELGEQDGHYFLAMEYVRGCALSDLMANVARKREHLDPWLAAWIAARVGEALHAAHQLRDEHGELLGVVHRDVSPQNVLLGHDGVVKLTDFGIAHAKGRASRTHQGEIRGKFRYMAPEQIAGRELDHRADVFSLGVLLWEMLAQRRLHADLAPDEVIAAVKTPNIVRPSEYQPGVPPQLEGIVLNALAAEREQRPNSAETLRAELDDAIADHLPEPEHALSEFIAKVLRGRVAADIPQASLGNGDVDIDIDIDEPVRHEAREASRRIRTAQVDEKKGSGWMVAVVLAIISLAAGAWWLTLD